jgi:hypothetical protein
MTKNNVRLPEAQVKNNFENFMVFFIKTLSSQNEKHRIEKLIRAIARAKKQFGSSGGVCQFPL